VSIESQQTRSLPLASSLAMASSSNTKMDENRSARESPSDASPSHPSHSHLRDYASRKWLQASIARKDFAYERNSPASNREKFANRPASFSPSHFPRACGAARGGGDPRSRSARYKASSHHRSLPPTLPLSHSPPPPPLLLFPAGKYLSFACGAGGGEGGEVIRERGPRCVSSLRAPMFSRVKRGRKIRQMVLPPPSPPRVLSLYVFICA